MTYALFEALIERKERADHEEYVRTGMLCASIINTSFRAPDDKVDVMDFVPGGKEKKNLMKMSHEEQAAYLIKEMNKRR